MMKIMNKIAVIATFGVLAFGGSAHAATFASCTSTNGGTWDVSGNVSTATSCTWRIDESQDNVNDPLVVNEGVGFFGYDDWSFVGKVGEDSWGDDEGQSGTYDLTSVSGLGSVVMLVFKDGVFGGTRATAGTEPYGLVGYVIDGLGGTWDTPFIQAATLELFGLSINNPKDTSHISVYTREVSVVPLPAAGWLLLMGIGGLGVASRRRRKAQHS